jgi:Ca2+-binding EF-hand superfamily protein
MVKTLMAFDKNGDGQLTREEVPERMQGLFERADINKDGILTADEIRKSAQAATASGGRGPGEERGASGRGPGMSFVHMDPILVALDADSNGEISAEELAAATVALKKLDKNGDGQLSEEEVRVNFGPGRGRGPGRQ